MGLDWLAGNRPVAGKEDVFWRLFRELEEQMDDRRLQEWLAIGVPSYQCVGAPVVGVDPEADEWLRERLATRGFFGEANEAKVRAMKGHVALELAENSDGLPVYSHGGLYDGVDETSFRGEFLHDCLECIGPALLDQATVRKVPEQGLVYGRALREKALEWAREHGCEHVIDVYQIESANRQEHVAHVVDSAGRWCQFWSSRGHLLDYWI